MASMTFGPSDLSTVEKILQALTMGMRRAEAETPDGRKVVGYFVTDGQVRIDIREK